MKNMSLARHVNKNQGDQFDLTIHELQSMIDIIMNGHLRPSSSSFLDTSLFNLSTEISAFIPTLNIMNKIEI